MDHDRLFKELLMTFFVEFLDLFFPDLVDDLDRDSVEFLDKEVFTDITEGDRREVDLVVKARFSDRPSCLVIHMEHQAQSQGDFARRMFCYFARLHEKYALPVYPIAVFSFAEPRRTEPNEYRVAFSDLDVLTFRFRVVQLNRLAWRDFVERTNPIAAALMAKMRMEPNERPWAKLACLDSLGKLQLDPARRALISGFVDTYLRLTMEEQKVFDGELSKIEPERQERVMEIVTSWMEQGVKQGKLDLVLRILRKRLGLVDAQIEARIAELSVGQIEALGEASLDFTRMADLTSWLDGDGET